MSIINSASVEQLIRSDMSTTNRYQNEKQIVFKCVQLNGARSLLYMHNNK